MKKLYRLISMGISVRSVAWGPQYHTGGSWVESRCEDCLNFAKGRSMKRRKFLQGLGVSVGLGGLTVMANGIETSRKLARNILFAIPPASQGTTLKAAAAGKGLLYGAATSRKILQSDPDFASAFVQQCGIMTPEGEMKWKALRPGIDKFRFDDADWLVNWAHQNGILFRGHTLVWGINLPDWVEKQVNHGNAEKVMVDHIRTVVGHYQGKLHSWDVVNEIIQPKDGRSDGLAKSVWLDNIGPDYVAKAFRAAKAADPNLSGLERTNAGIRSSLQ